MKNFFMLVVLLFFAGALFCADNNVLPSNFVGKMYVTHMTYVDLETDEVLKDEDVTNSLFMMNVRADSFAFYQDPYTYTKIHRLVYKEDLGYDVHILEDDGSVSEGWFFIKDKGNNNFLIVLIDDTGDQALLMMFYCVKK